MCFVQVSIWKCLPYGSSKSERHKFFGLVRVWIRWGRKVIGRKFGEVTNARIMFVKQLRSTIFEWSYR